MSATSLFENRHTCFQFKTSFAPCTIMQVLHYELDVLQDELTHMISHAPNFFLGAPIVIDLEKVNHVENIDFSRLKDILIARHLVPMGVRNGSPEQMKIAASYGLPALSVGKLFESGNKKVETVKHEPTRLITSPIRSGTQIYAKEADLVVVAQVSPGAELMADGHIHVYGALRGRAMAGVQGNKNARIFCHTLEAELIAIAGFYLTREDMESLPESRGMIQIYLDNDQVRIETI